MQNRGIWKNTKKFFSPLLQYKIISLKGMVPAVFGSSITIAIVYLVKEITNLLENGFSNTVLNLIIIFGILISHLLKTLSKVLLRNTYFIKRIRLQGDGCF